MFKSKRFISFVVILLLFSGLMISCNNNDKEDKFSIVCSDFSQYDWTKNILGENAELFSLTYLLSDGSDPHSFQPSIEDIALISQCDLFIYLGGPSDSWTKEILKNAVNKDMQVLCVYDMFKDELLPMSDSSCEEGEDHSDHHHAGEDEHIWLSLVNAKKIVKAIEESVVKIHSEGESVYASNLENYIAKLNELDVKYKKSVENSAANTLVFADRFPFAYLARDYSIQYYAAYSGCSADSELSEDRIIFLANTADSLKLKYICVTESADQRIAETVVNQMKEKNAEILKLNSCQSVTKSQVDNGLSYIGVMESNLDLLIKALG